MDRNTLLRRLKERKFVQWVLIYLAGAWALLQFGDFLGDAFDWPPAAMQALLVVAAFGFLAVLVVAWYHGERGHQSVKTTEVLLLVAIAAVASAATWQVAVRAPSSADDAGAGVMPVSRVGEADPRSIAVLPFVNIGGDAENEYFSDGITEDIIAQLARVDGLRVISRTSVMQYKGTEKTVRQIGAELGVAAVLEGSVRRSGDRVRIVAQLIDVRTDEHLWAETYDRGIQDVLKIQADVAQRIATELQAELSPVQVAELSDREVDPEAYRLYLKGRELAKGDAPADAEKAAELFSDALRIDSTFVFAYTALAETVGPLDDALEPGMDSVLMRMPRVDSMVRRAMARVPRAPEIQTLAARQQLQHWNFEAAVETARRAAAQHPNHAPARHAYGVALARRGDYDGALRELNAALALDPHSPAIQSAVGEVHFAAGHFDEAIRQLSATVQRHPADAEARLDLALAYRAKGMHEEAVQQLRRAAMLARNDAVVLGHLGQLLAETGQEEEARRILDRLVEGGRRVPPTAIAQIHSGLGDVAEATRWLERATRERSATLISPRANRVFGEMKLDSVTVRAMLLAPPPPPPVRDTLPAGPRG